MLALQLKPLEEAKAKARQLRKPADSVSPNSDEQTRTDYYDVMGHWWGTHCQIMGIIQHNRE